MEGEAPRRAHSAGEVGGLAPQKGVGAGLAGNRCCPAWCRAISAWSTSDDAAS